MRSSRQDTEHRREEIVAAAARLVREKGLDGMSVPQLMADVGMTHGGFYRHFDSKQALEAEALKRAFADVVTQTEGLTSQNDGLAQLVTTYLGAAHRDSPGSGCPTSALVGDMAREPTDSPIRSTYVNGVEGMVGAVAALQDPKAPDAHAKALVTLSTMVGALLLARATRGTPLSDNLLAAATRDILQGD